MPSPPLMRDHHQRAPARSCSPPSLTSKGSMEKKLLVTHLPWVSNWRWYSWNSLLCKVTAESQAFHSPFKRLTPKEKKHSAKRFYAAHSVFPVPGKQEDGSTSRIWSCVRSWKLLVSFPIWNNQKEDSAITLSLCTRAQGNVRVWSTKHLFPCSPWGSLGGRVVWFISLNCQLMNGTRPSTATRCRKRKAPRGCSSWGLSHTH